MMSIIEGLRTYLLTVPEVTALCGQQIYGARRPQGIRPLPEILISPTTTQRFYNFCGQAALVSSELQIDCYGVGLEDATAMARALRRTLRAGGVFGDVPVDSVFLSNDLGAVDSDPGTVRLVQTFIFWHQED